MCLSTARGVCELPLDDTSPARARQFLRRATCVEHAGHVLEDAVLLVSEVVTNETRSIRRAETGSDHPIVVNVFGPRLDVLGRKADEVSRAITEIDGVRSLDVERSVEQPQIEVTVRLARAQRHGLKPGDVRREAATLMAGLEVGSLFEEQKVFSVAVWSEPDARRSVSDLESLLINTPAGDRVRLGEVADVRLTPSPAVIQREAVSRRVRIGVNVEGRDPDAVAGDIRSSLEGISFPFEYHAEVRGESADARDSRNLMIAAGVVAAIAIFLLLQAAFGSWALAGLLFLTLPFALVGGVLAAYLADDVVTLASLVGFLAILGIAARNSVVLIRHFRHLEHEEKVPFGPDLVVRGARERVVPVLLTAVATLLAFTPLLATGAIAGQEIAHPIAVIFLGGIVTATALTLFLIPALYLRFGSRPAPEEAL